MRLSRWAIGGQRDVVPPVAPKRGEAKIHPITRGWRAPPGPHPTTMPVAEHALQVGEDAAVGDRPDGLPSVTSAERVLLLNCDDLGLYEAVNEAVISSIENGVAQSCSLMVPTPGAAQAMQLLAHRPHIHSGVHLTLVCDLPAVPWGPVAPQAAVPSLLADDGGFLPPSLIPQLLAQARIEEVEREFRAQLEVVLRAGLSPTHLDWHCLADGGRQDIFDVTLDLAREHGLATRAWLPPARARLRAEGSPVLDHDFLDSFTMDLPDKTRRYLQMLRDLPAGRTEWAVHPGLDTDDARRVDPGWRVRSSDHAFLTSPLAQQVIGEEGIRVIDYIDLQLHP